MAKGFGNRASSLDGSEVENRERNATGVFHIFFNLRDVPRFPSDTKFPTRAACSNLFTRRAGGDVGANHARQQVFQHRFRIITQPRVNG